LIRLLQGERRYRVASYWLDVPDVGPWFASVRIESSTTPVTVGLVTLTDETNSWTGTARAVSTDGAVTVLDIIGGANALQAVTVPRQWAASVPVASVLASMCGDAGETPATSSGDLSSWRARGGSLAQELSRLATWASGGDWRVTPAGEVEVAARAFATATAPGKPMGVECGAVRYDCPTLAEVAGKTIDGRRIGRALYVSGADSPYVDTWETAPRNTAGARGIVGAKVDAQTDGRVDVTLDDGSQMVDIPLWASPGVRAIVTIGARVLVVDLADDPRGGFAMSGPWDAGADEWMATASTSATVTAPTITLDGDVDAGNADAASLRDGDIVMLIDFPNPAVPGAPPFITAGILPTSWAMVKLAPPVAIAPGPPGVGHSRVNT